MPNMIGVFDGEKIQYVSSGALAMAMHLRNTINFEDSKPLRNNSLFIKFSEIVRENKDLRKENNHLLQDIASLETERLVHKRVLERKERQLQSLEKELDKYDKVFKKYDRMFGVVMPVIKSSMAASVTLALWRTLQEIWRE